MNKPSYERMIICNQTPICSILGNGRGFYGGNTSLTKYIFPIYSYISKLFANTGRGVIYINFIYETPGGSLLEYVLPGIILFAIKGQILEQSKSAYIFTIGVQYRLRPTIIILVSGSFITFLNLLFFNTFKFIYFFLKMSLITFFSLPNFKAL